MKKILYFLLLTAFILSFSACISLERSLYHVYSAYSEVEYNGALRLSKVIEASWFYHKKNLKWPYVPDELKRTNTKEGTPVDFSIFESLYFEISSENLFQIHFNMKPYQFKSEKRDLQYHVSRMSGIVTFCLPLDQNVPDPLIMFSGFEAESEGPGIIFKEKIKIILHTFEELSYKEIIEKWERMKDSKPPGT